MDPVVAQLGELVRVDAQLGGHVGGELLPRRGAQVHGHPGPDEEQRLPVPHRLDQLAHGLPPRSIGESPGGFRNLTSASTKRQTPAHEDAP
jgi:hypothetical protein